MINLSKYSPIEYVQYPGFYVIPGIDNYVVNIVGDVRQLCNSVHRSTGDVICNSFHKGYLINDIYLNSGKCVKYKNHRLVCLAFYGPPEPEQTHCNHKDGIRDNNYFKNVEWCTPLENNQHAWDTGLNLGGVKPILVWDIVDDPNRIDIKEYTSINAAAEALPNTTAAAISETLHSVKIYRLYLRRYLFKFKTTIDDWPTLETIEKNAKYRYVYAYNLSTKLTYVGVDMAALSKKIKVDRRTIHFCFLKPLKHFYPEWLFSFDSNEDWSKQEELFHLKYSTIICYDILNKLIILHNSQYEMEILMKFPLNALAPLLRKKKYKYKNYLIFYQTDKSEYLTELKSQYNINL